MAILLASHHLYPDGVRVDHRRAVLGILDGSRRLAVQWEEDRADCVMLLIERAAGRFFGRIRRCGPGSAETIVDVSMLLVSHGPDVWRFEGSYVEGDGEPRPWTVVAIRPNSTRPATDSEGEAP